ncbi:hypothetical protein FF38_03795 [Lucilia cuprina]|uniref:Uncharacterized protein n=1 Tax=Lucilia cuprina TaxID=7375 RepID=A0A0L0C167_LUCCU|nr:hypothetical protein FF38_03795 [Lucilia cuprina]
MSVHSGTLTSRSVHPASPVLLTKNGPLKALHSRVQVQLSNKDVLHIQSLRIGQDRFNPNTSNHSLYPIKLIRASAILRETSAGTSY